MDCDWVTRGILLTNTKEEVRKLPFIKAQKQMGQSWWRDEFDVPQKSYMYYWLVESYRDKKGRPRQRKLLYLGTVKIPLEDALKYYETYKKNVKDRGKFIANLLAKHWRRKMYLKYG